MKTTASDPEPDLGSSPEPVAPGSGPRPPPNRSEDRTAPDAIPFEEIRERAYELWERNHRPEGFEIEFWLLAERELRKERNRRKADAAPPAPAADPETH
ncbi:DUF2934 domain-containing protein [Methylobacterium pseudosasicola]|uniref:DUF2934 domain-containing protein n=1 Tax=Methylobacterium pseudosasicola TaxID=582667 RepID=A0A1I4HGN0_9HYPH|nr:Protein of unknown function [Methylobacterium pseudosasicola]